MADIPVQRGFTSEHLPIGLQIGGKPFAEQTVLNVAYAYQQATDWHRRRPPIEMGDIPAIRNIHYMCP